MGPCSSLLTTPRVMRSTASFSVTLKPYTHDASSFSAKARNTRVSRNNRVSGGRPGWPNKALERAENGTAAEGDHLAQPLDLGA